MRIAIRWILHERQRRRESGRVNAAAQLSAQIDDERERREHRNADDTNGPHTAILILVPFNAVTRINRAIVVNCHRMHRNRGVQSATFSTLAALDDAVD